MEVKFKENTENSLHQLKTSISTLESTSNSQIDSLHTKIDKLDAELSTKVSLTQHSKVYDQFQRFAEYNDLKKLHGFILTEIDKFERKIAES